MASEINEKTRFSFGVKELVTILVPVVMFVGGYFTIKINTENAIHDLQSRIEKIEEVKPELLQYKLGQVSSEIQAIRDDFKSVNEKIDKIYNVIISK